MFLVATRPGIWFWFVALLGAALRLYLVVFTQGTRDVELWQQHASAVRDFGLIGYYHTSEEANHPPFISYAESLLLRAADALGIPYRVFLRLPFALLDAGTTALLALVLAGSRGRWWLTALYWLNPLAVILSAYHGNTDSAIPFFLLLCIWLLSKGNMIGAAIAMGTSLWIKLPGILALPALVLLIQKRHKRLLFVTATGIMAILSYLPALIADAQIVIANVFGYHGRQLYTTGHIPVWGTKVLLFSFIAPPEKWPEQLHTPVLFFINHSWQLALIWPCYSCGYAGRAAPFRQSARRLACFTWSFTASAIAGPFNILLGRCRSGFSCQNGFSFRQLRSEPRISIRSIGSCAATLGSWANGILSAIPFGRLACCGFAISPFCSFSSAHAFSLPRRKEQCATLLVRFIANSFPVLH